MNAARMFHVLMTICHSERPLSRPATLGTMFDRLKPTSNIFALPFQTDLQRARSVYSELLVDFLLRRLTSEDLRGWYL